MGIDNPPFVSSIKVTLNDGSGFEMSMDEGFASGTTFDNGLPDSALELEAAIQDAIQKVGLNPVRDEADGTDYVVDVYVPFAVMVRAAKGDTEMAASMAVEDFERSGLRERMDALVNEDFDNSFTISDSAYQTEVGEA